MTYTNRELRKFSCVHKIPFEKTFLIYNCNIDSFFINIIKWHLLYCTKTSSVARKFEKFECKFEGKAGGTMFEFQTELMTNFVTHSSTK